MKAWVLVLISVSIAQSAWAEEKSVTRKTEEAIQQGAESAERGIEKAVAATQRGIEKGAAATERAVNKASGWVDEKLHLGGEKIEKASE